MKWEKSMGTPTDGLDRAGAVRLLGWDTRGAPNHGLDMG